MTSLNDIVENAKMKRKAMTIYGVIESAAIPLVKKLKQSQDFCNISDEMLKANVVGMLVYGDNPMTNQLSDKIKAEIKYIFHVKFARIMLEKAIG